MYESTAVEQIISKLKWYWFQIHQINSDDCLPSETTLRHLDYTNLGVLNWTDSTTQEASAYIAPYRKFWSFWQRNNQDVRLFPWSGSLFSIQEEVFFSVTTQWLNACTWELASRNFLDGLSVTIKAFSQLCKAQNGNQEGPLLQGSPFVTALFFWSLRKRLMNFKRNLRIVT